MQKPDVILLTDHTDTIFLNKLLGPHKVAHELRRAGYHVVVINHLHIFTFEEICYLLEELITETVKSWHWYDQMLFNLYRDSGLSYRQISAVTGISFKSIYSTITNCKKSLKHEVKEHYEDYINQDYELIK
jgi:hypothetical protein